jgi:hypothetical protein
MNPYSLVISVREGDLVLEGLIHRYLYSLGLQFNMSGRRLEEWFINDPEVLRVFHLPRETIERFVWKNRDKAFNTGSNGDILDYSSFEYLYNRHIDKFVGVAYKVVGNQLIKTKAKKVDLDFWRVYLKNQRRDPYDMEDVDEAYRPIVTDFMNAFLSTNLFIYKMRLYCEFMDSNQDNEYLKNAIDYRINDSKFRNYYNLFGTKGCRAVGFQEARLVPHLDDMMKRDLLKEQILKRFPIKSRISRKKAKEVLGEIYNDLGINAAPKASDIESFLELREIKIQEGGKRVNGYEVIATK